MLIFLCATIVLGEQYLRVVCVRRRTALLCPLFRRIRTGHALFFAGEVASRYICDFFYWNFVLLLCNHIVVIYNREQVHEELSVGFYSF